MPEQVTLYEVGPRDGLQNEPRTIVTRDKVALIKALVAAGLRNVEVGSFVSPTWVPQMADTAQVLAGLDYGADCNYAVLVPNSKGYESWRRARATLPRAPGEVAIFVAASEGFSRANLNCSIDESFERLAPVVAAATSDGVKLRGYVSCVTDCPYDGPTPPQAVARVVARMLDLAPMAVSLGDTIGAGRPDTVRSMLRAVFDHAPASALAGHFHDTGGHAMANIEASLELGLRVFDTSIAGLGGCPYAPGAPGNVATELVVKRLGQLGYDTGLDEAALAAAARQARAMRS